MSDGELLAAHRSGHPWAFAELVRRYQDEMWAIALRTLRHPEDASDAIQETLATAHRKAAGYRGDGGVGAWLHRILVNTCIDRIRHERVRPTVPLPGGEVEAPDRRTDPGPLATRLDVLNALAELPVPQRLAVVLVDVQGYPVAEAAGILGVPVGTVKSRCARGRARLAELLGHLREEVT